jgi:hypothetical protein
MKPTKPQMQKWFNDLSAGDRNTVNQAEKKSADAARPLLTRDGLIDVNDSDEDVLEILRMRF